MPSSKVDYLRLVQELLALEDKNSLTDLDVEERQRLVELSKVLFGLPGILAEKRKHFRVQASLPAEVVSPLRDSAAKVRSLSCGGFFVETNEAPEVGTKMDMRVAFPRRADVCLPFTVQVRWVSPGAGASAPRGIGVSFVDLDDQQRTAVLAALRDQLVDNLERALDRFEFFFEHSPDMSVLIAHDTTIVELNEQARRLLRPHGPDLGGRKLADMLAPESSATLLESASRAQLEHGTLRREIEIPQGKDKPPIPVELLITSGRSEDLDLGTLVVGRDISERREIELQRRSMERRLYQSDKLASLGRIAAGIAHDINNPLAWVLSNLSLLETYSEPLITLVSQRKTSPPEQPGVSTAELEEIDENLTDLIAESLEGVRRIRDIILDLKMFSRVDVSDESDVDLNEAIDTSLRIVRNQVTQRAHVICEFDELPKTYANFGKVCQIFINLIANTVSAFDNTDVKSNRVELRTWNEGELIHASVKDNGRGIPDELQSKIFEPFFTLQSEQGGTGLGLPIAMDAVNALEGSIELKSTVGVGTEFIVSLPVREHAPQKPDRGKKSSIPPQHRPRLLVVDDETTLLRAFTRSLKRRWRVSTASSVAEAIELFDTEPFDVVLCDVMIPGTSGIAFYDELAKRDSGHEHRIVFMTGGAFAEREKTMLENLPNIVIEKPFDMREIEELLVDLLSRNGSFRSPR